MYEDEYTGHLIDDDLEDLVVPLDEELMEWSEDDFEDDLETTDETVVSVITAVEGSKTLKDTAERLYEYADELLSLAAIGWELVDDISSGRGVALMLGDDDDYFDDEEDYDDE